MPVLLLLVLGLIQYGFYFRSLQGGSAAAREGARRAAVGEFAPCDAFETYVLEQVGTSSSPANTATVTRTYTDEDGNTVNTSADLTVGDTVTVTVSFHSVDLHIPFLPFVHDGQVFQSAASRLENIVDADNPPEICS